MTEPLSPELEAPDRPASREVVDRLMQAYGEEVHRYCVAMLGWDGAAAMLPTILGHLEDHAGALEPDAERLLVLAVAHNRCVERSRTGGRPSLEPGLPERSARAMRAMAQLQPVGRDAVALRLALGLRWSELERVCGVPLPRLVMRVCRAWRNMGEVMDGRPAGPRPRPAGRRLDESPARWAAIREDARRFVALREVLREVIEGYRPSEGWQRQAWVRLEQEREDEQRVAVERAAERAAAEAERIARAEREAAAAAEAAEPIGGAFSGATDEDQAEDRTPIARAGSWRWVKLGVLLAVVGLVARWLMLR